MARSFRRRRSLPVPKAESLQFKPKTAWRLIGQETSTYDQQDIVTGKAQFGLDVFRDGMVYASIEHPPVLGGTVKSVNDAEARAVKGVQQTVTLDTFKPPHLFQPLGGVAVIADNTWAALQGRKKLKVDWNDGPHAVVRIRGVQEAAAADGESAGEGARGISATWTPSSRRAARCSKRRTSRRLRRTRRWSRRPRLPTCETARRPSGRRRRIRRPYRTPCRPCSASTRRTSSVTSRCLAVALAGSRSRITRAEAAVLSRSCRSR